MMNWNLEDCLIFLGVSGSRAYGTATPESDVDLRGICKPPRSVREDPFTKFEQKDKFEGEDKVLYSLSKFFKLCADANPNVLELLYIPQDLWEYHDRRWLYICKNRDLFLSKKISKTFMGYATSQLKRIVRHREWLLNPPEKKPERSDFGLGAQPEIKNIEAYRNIPHVYLADGIRETVEKELAYAEAKRKWDEYNQWAASRNPSRKALEEKFGYDTKAAAHLVRIVHECYEILINGRLTLPLTYADRVRDVRDGCMTYEELLAYAKDIEEIYYPKWVEYSYLPSEPDYDKLRKLYFDVLDMLP